MENLTESFGVVKTNVTPAPRKGYKVVVYNEKRGGRTLYKTLDQDDRPLKNWFSSKLNYVAYAVNINPNLSFEKSTEVLLPAQYKHFTLGCKVYFKVIDAEQLTVWFKDDPIRLIWDEIKSQVSNNIKKDDIKIEDVKFQFAKVEKRILTDNFWESIKETSKEYGIHIKEIILDYTLPEEELEVDIARDKHDREMKIDILNKEKEMAKQTGEMHTKKHELYLKRMESANDAISETYKQLPEGVKQMTEHITGPDSFKDSFDALMESTEKHFDNPRKQVNHNDIYLMGDKKKALGVGKVGSFEELQKSLKDILDEIEVLEFNENDKILIRSTANHLRAELDCGEKADFDVIDRNLEQLDGYRAKYKGIIPLEFMERVKHFKAKLREVRPQERPGKDMKS